MTWLDVDQLQRPEVLLAGLAVSVLVLAWIARRVRRFAKSPRPDEPLSNLAMLIGLGWSSEAVWEITGRIEWPLSLRLLLFFVLETLLVLSMIRAKRAMREIGHPGRSGRTVWIVASAMAVVAIGASSSFGEAVLRLVIPLLLTRQWWDGLVGEGPLRREDATSWRWTPRRLLLWLGAIEPGERDVETVHRERLTQQMTRLEFRRRHGSEKQKERAARRLARLSLTADDAIVADVRDRVDRAMWFDGGRTPEAASEPRSGVPAAAAASARSRRVRHRRSLRTLRLTHPRPVIIAAQEPRQDPRTTQDLEAAVCAIKAGAPELSQRRIAVLAATSDATVRRALRRTKAAEPTQINGRKPDLEAVPS